MTITDSTENQDLKETEDEGVTLVNYSAETVIEDPESLIDALGMCGLFSKETELIPDIVKFDDHIFNEEYYRKKHGQAFPDSWYKIMAEVSKKKFEDLRNQSRQLERLAAATVTWDNNETCGGVASVEPQQGS